MKDAANIMIDEFIVRLDNDYALFYLKGTERKVYLKRSFDDSYVLGTVDQGFLITATNYIINKIDDRLLHFANDDGLILFSLQRDKWEVDA